MGNFSETAAGATAIITSSPSDIDPMQANSKYDNKTCRDACKTRDSCVGFIQLGKDVSTCHFFSSTGEPFYDENVKSTLLKDGTNYSNDPKTSLAAYNKAAKERKQRPRVTPPPPPPQPVTPQPVTPPPTNDNNSRRPVSSNSEASQAPVAASKDNTLLYAIGIPAIILTFIIIIFAIYYFYSTQKTVT